MNEKNLGGLSCRQLLEEPSLNALTLIGGESGLDRIVRWTYMAEIFNEFTHPEDWLTGNELVFVNGNNVGGNIDELVSLIKTLNKINAAGVVIMVGPFISEVPDSIIELCNQLSFPLFTIPWDIKIVEFTYALGQVIITNSIKMNLFSRFAEKIMQSGTAEIEIIGKEVNKVYGLDLSSDCVIGIIAIDDSKNNSGNFTKVPNTNIQNKLANIAVESFNAKKVKILAAPIHDIIMLIFNAVNLEAKTIYHVLEIMHKKLKNHNHSIKLRMGMGNPYKNWEQCRESFKQALKACMVAQSNDDIICFYSSMGADKLLLHLLKDKQLLEEYYYDILGHLVSYDNLNGTSLLNTLNAYFNSNFSMDAAARDLFIHRNTLKYRLNKIEEILHCNLNSIEDITNIEMCFKIDKLLKYWHQYSYFLC